MRCIIGTVLTDSVASLTASLEPSQLMAPVLSLVERVIYQYLSAFALSVRSYRRFFAEELPALGATV